MKKSKSIIPILVLVANMALMQSCKKDSSTPREFIADNNSFGSFMNWSLDKTYNGPDPLLGAMAHANNDSTVVRDVYFKDGQKPSNSKYPIGTLIVKYSHNPNGTVNEHTAMAKRGNNFNPDHGDWEWFVLNKDGTVATDSASGMKMRGANLMNGMCISCHTGASKDYVFSK